MAEDLIPHNEVEEGAIIVAVTPDAVENNHTSAPKANANFVTPVTNGTTKTKKQNFPKTVTGPTEVKSGEKLEYIISAYEENNKDTLDKDKERMRWCFYIDGVKLNGSKKHVQIKNSENQKEDAGDNFLIIGNLAKKTLAIENDSYLYAKAEVIEEDGEKKNKLTIVFSKWLDGKKVYVEVFRNRPDHNPKKGYVVTSTVTAKPEVININWVNAKEEPIKFAGYDQDVFLQVETIGMKDKELNLDILDYDKGGEDDKLDWGVNSIKITGRKTLKQFPIKKKTEYGLQQKDENKPGLDLYVVVNSSEPLENCKDKYATYLDLNPDEKIITAYFAEERKKEVQKGEEPPKLKPKKEAPKEPTEYKVIKGDDLAKIAKKTGVPYTQIMEANPNTEWTKLIPKKTKLTIPPKKEESTPKEKEKDTKTITYYQKIDSAYLGNKVFLTAETQNLEGKTVMFKVFEKEPILISEKEKPLTLLVGEQENTEIEAKVTDGKAQVVVVLQRKEDKAKDDWKDKLSPQEKEVPNAYHDNVLNQSVNMTSFDFRLMAEPDRYTPVVETIPAKKTYFWLQVTCEGDQLDFDQPFLKRSGLEVSINTGDHGDYHDPVINPQVRGWYHSESTKNKNSAIIGWNPYGSLKYEHKKHKASDGTPKYEYGRPQRGGNSHSGVDIYAPVGTPVYACVDGKISYHKFFGKKAGFLTQLKGKYKDKTYTFQYLHLMEIKKDKFRFYNNYKNDPKIKNDGWKNYSGLENPLVDPIVEESYEVSYNGSELKIDKNTVDINTIIKLNDLFESKGVVEVKKGDIIGYTGSTGNSYQGKKRNHLHFGIKDASGNRISPYELLEQYINLDESGVETSSKQDGETPSSEW